jgi:hypothetical protein
MKHLRLFESFKEEDIQDICKKLRIENYTINEDGSIDVDGYVGIDRNGLTKLPLNFRKITRYFSCSSNYLTSLEGCPESVGSDFICYYNNLTSLKGCPKSVGGDFECQSNNLTSFEGCPKFIGGDFKCRNNRIATFEHLPYSIGGNFYCVDNPIWEIWNLFYDYSKIEFLNDCDAIREPNIIVLDRLNFFLEEIGKKPVYYVKGYDCI